MNTATTSRMTAVSSHNSEAQPSVANSLDFGLLKLRSQAAQEEWASCALKEKRKIFEAFKQRLVEGSDLIADRVAAHRDCTVAEALATEVIPLADAAEYLSKNFTHLLAPKRLGRRGRPSWLMGVDCEVRRQPLGLILIISPGNYPLFLAAVQILQALAAGNSVWVKPSPGSTHIISEFRQLLIEAGLNHELIQILPETVAAVEAAFVAGVDKVVFTGSASTGRKILSRLAPHLTPSVMELSGCDALFVRSDADLELVVEALRFGLTLNNGSTCIAPRRIFVPRELLSEFTKKLRNELVATKPIRLSQESCQPWLSWVKDALAEGAFIVSGTLYSDRIDGPMVLSSTSADLKLLQDDTFAPVATIVPVDSDSEAITINNTCPFALSASVFGRDHRAARHLANGIKAGSVLINDLIAPTADPRIPFGGLANSGFGSTRGAEGLLEMTAPKVISNNKSGRRLHYRPFVDGDTNLFRALLRLSHGKTITERFRALRTAISSFKNSTNNTISSQS